MEIGTNFTNLESYNANMAKGMEDKLWFINHLNLENNYTFVDFGCADGTLINILSQINGFQSNKYIGYDISEQMIDLAKTKHNWNPNINVFFTYDWNKISERLKKTRKYKVLILSSVIHEVYSYGTDFSIRAFWEKVLNTGFDYIFIRDMMCSMDLSRHSCDGYLSKINWALGKGVISKEQIESFEKQFGELSYQKNLVHFLLKYRWKINWDREVKENYFPVTIEEFLDKIKEEYNINYLERFRVPFLEECWRQDFMIEVEDYTHIKLFLEKKKC